VKKKKIRFYVAYPYYFPHFLPIGDYFSRQGHEVGYVLSARQNREVMEKIAREEGLEYTFDEGELAHQQTDVAFFANRYEGMESLPALTVLMEHGIGTKKLSGLYGAIREADLYLVESTFQLEKMSREYPQYRHKLALVGFSKLDPIVNMSREERERIYRKHRLDPSRKTILYAPTFFPSSIERMGDGFPGEFPGCNVIVKPHYLSYQRKRYRKQRKKFQRWSTYENCRVVPVEEYNLLPFLAIADVMISDESSAMFEFAALNKPVVSNQYFGLRWSYRLMPWKLKKRIDPSKDKYRGMFETATGYEETLRLTREALEDPGRLEAQRLAFAREVCGEIDGRVSERIYQAVMERIGA